MHLFCCYWLPEMYVSHGNQASMEPIEGLANINKGRRGLQCCLCKSKYGLCIQCSVPQCRLAFHATCARQAGLLMDENR